MWPLVNTGKNNKKDKTWAAKGWLRSLNKGGHLLKMTITMFVLYAGKFGALKTATTVAVKTVNTVKTNNWTKRIGTAHEKTNKHSKRHETNVVYD